MYPCVPLRKMMAWSFLTTLSIVDAAGIQNHIVQRWDIKPSGAPRSYPTLGKRYTTLGKRQPFQGGPSAEDTSLPLGEAADETHANIAEEGKINTTRTCAPRTSSALATRQSQLPRDLSPQQHDVADAARSNSQPAPRWLQRLPNPAWLNIVNFAFPTWCQFLGKLSAIISALTEFQKQLLDTEALALWLFGYSTTYALDPSSTTADFFEKSRLRKNTFILLSNIRNIVETAMDENVEASRAWDWLQNVKLVAETQESLQRIENGIENEIEAEERRSEKFQQFLSSFDLLKAAFAEVVGRITGNFPVIYPEERHFSIALQDTSVEKRVETLQLYSAKLKSLEEAVSQVRFINRRGYAQDRTDFIGLVPITLRDHRHGQIVTLSRPLAGKTRCRTRLVHRLTARRDPDDTFLQAMRKHCGWSKPMLWRGVELTAAQECDLVYGRPDGEDLNGEICAVMMNPPYDVFKDILFAIRFEGANLQHARRVLGVSDTMPIVLWVYDSNIGKSRGHNMCRDCRSVQRESQRVVSGLATQCMESCEQRQRRPVLENRGRSPAMITDSSQYESEGVDSE